MKKEKMRSGNILWVRNKSTTKTLQVTTLKGGKNNNNQTKKKSKLTFPTTGLQDPNYGEVFK